MKTTNRISFMTLLLTGAVLITTSCSDKKERQALQQRTQQLEQQLADRDSAFNAVMSTMSSVENQIASIKDRENIVTLKSEESMTSADKDQIVSDMESIDKMIENSTQTIQDLAKKLDKADMSLSSFKSRVNELSKQLQSRKEAIAGLKDVLQEKDVQIAELNTQVGSLETRVELQTETIDMQVSKINLQEDKLNTAYFLVGPEKKLKDQGIVNKEGGFLWLGRTTELEEDASKDEFVAIDIKYTDKLIVDSKKVELVTEHPSDSYKWVKKGDKVEYLSITNPEKFWEISKYLVITTNG